MGAFPSHGHFLDLGMGSDLNLCLGTAMSGVLAKGLGRSLGLRVGGALALNCNLVRKALPIMNLPTEPLGRGSALARIALRFGTRAITTEPLLAFVWPRGALPRRARCRHACEETYNCEHDKA